MRKPILGWVGCVTALLVLVSLLAGCGGLAFSTPEPVELTFVYFEHAADYQPLADAFHSKYPHITVKLDPASPQGGGRALLEKAAAADVLRMPVMNIPGELAAAFLPLDTMLSTSQGFPQADLFPGTLEGLRIDGKQIGLPAGTNPFVVYYLPRKFAAAGIRPPAPNWTLDDFVSTAKAIHNTDPSAVSTDRFAYGFCTYPSFPDVALFTYLFGGGLVDNLVQISQPTLNDPGNVESLAWYASLKNDLGLIPSLNSPRDVGALVYRQGCGLWVDWLDKSTFGPEGAPEAEPLPLPRHIASMNIASQDGYFLLSRTEHPDEAFLWARFLMEEQAASGRLIPPLRASVESREYAGRVPESILSVARGLPEQTLVISLEMTRNERFGGVLELFGQAALKVINEAGDAQFTLDEAQQQAEERFR